MAVGSEAHGGIRILLRAAGMECGNEVAYSEAGRVSDARVCGVVIQQNSELRNKDPQARVATELLRRGCARLPPVRANGTVPPPAAINTDIELPGHTSRQRRSLPAPKGKYCHL